MFNLGKVVMTQGIVNIIDDDPFKELELSQKLALYRAGYWGNTCKEDCQLNDEAIKSNDRIVAKYLFFGRDIFIITEADRSVTTILLTDEY